MWFQTGCEEGQILQSDSDIDLEESDTNSDVCSEDYEESLGEESEDDESNKSEDDENASVPLNVARRKLKVSLKSLHVHESLNLVKESVYNHLW